MAVRKLRTKIFLVLLSVVLLSVLALAALPLWFPWALGPVAKRFGASYADYRRVGYQRFELSNFGLTNGTTQVHAEQVRAFVPTAWLWRHFSGEKNEDFVTVKSWSYEPVEATTASSNASPVSVRASFEDVREVSAALRDWLPTAKLTNGTVRIDQQDVRIETAYWTNGSLAAVLSMSNMPPVKVLASTKAGEPWELRIDSEEREFHSVLSIDDRDDKLAVTGGVEVMTNHFDIAAEFPARGFIPATASVRAKAFTVPARSLGIPEYGDVAGSMEATWQTNHYNVQVVAKAAPQGTNLPPLDVELEASGDTNGAQLNVAKIVVPGMQASLVDPVALQFKPPYLSHAARMDFTADLDQQHWFIANGKVSGTATVYRGDKWPRAVFTASGAGVSTTSITTSNLAVEGELNWPVLDVKSTQVVMDDGSKISVTGKYDIASKTVTDGRVESSGAFGGQFLPADYSFASAQMTAQFSGPLTNLTHSATGEVKRVIVPGLNPVDVEVAWNGEGLHFQKAQAVVKAGGSVLSLRGSASFVAQEKGIELAALELSSSNQPPMRLQQPARLAIQETNGAWRLNISPIALGDGSRAVRLAADFDWPRRGSIQCSANGLDARLLRDFIPQANSKAVLNHFTFDGGWTNGPVAFRLAADATLTTQEKLPFSASAKLSGGKSGISIDHLSVSSATQIVCRAEGALPVSFDPTRKEEMLQIDAQAPLKVEALTDPKSILWEKIAEATGLRLREPNLTANLEGTWAAPQGQVTLQVQRIDFPQSEHPLPAIQNVDFLAVMDKAAARVEKCNFEVEQQPVTVTGEIPLHESFWAGLRHKRALPDWREASAHLKMENAQLAPFAPLLPQILSAEGTASADISLVPGGALHGELSVTNARTHALESIGPVRNIQLLARLDGRQLRLESASGEVGGQRVNVEGSVEVNEQLWRTNGLPNFEVRVSGTNVPLARNPSILLRADLDLAATNSGVQVPVIYGKVKLRDSLFLADIQTLVPERTSSARKRPPYFSVEAEPWAHWRLRVNVAGDGFLRVQTPLFHGKVSTVMSLEGTLKDPVALGQVKIDPGSSITFPFSSLDVKQGFVSLTSEDPYRPNLFVTAQARRFGYDVKMEATGPVDQPVVQFSSVPGLSSEEIVLMLTAGQVPHGVGMTTTTQQRAQGLALFVGKNLLSDFGLGGGGQERLTIRSGEEITETGRPTYDIEYQLTPRWSVIGEYDRFDQYNLNVKYKIYSK